MVRYVPRTTSIFSNQRV
uniref:Uncharacterized protein n=1 Tax=Arundo donax TaxID=35708 RepID=A0A0A9EP63_ARUDO